MVELNTLDLVVIAVYLAGVLALGLWAGRKEESADDYFLAGRALPWYLIGLSFYASNMSGASFVGLMGAAYSEGLSVFHYEWTAALVLIVFALFMLPVFLRAGLFTITGYLETRFDRRSRWAYASFTLATLLFIDMAGALYAGSVVVTTAFPGLALWQVSLGLALMAGLYTYFGGLKAVVVTDAVQAVLILAGTVLIVWLGLEAVGGLDTLLDAAPDHHRQMMRPTDDAFLPTPGILGVLLLGFYYWTLNQYFVQRALGAKSLDEGRKGALLGGLLKLPNIFLMVLPGMIAFSLMPELESPDQAFPALAFELLPAGLRGLILTALVAAIMSSLDSALNAAASILTMDFVKPLRPETGSKALLRIGRGFTAALILIAALYAPMIASFGSLFAYFQSTLAYLVPAIVAVYAAGLFWRGATASGAFAGLLAGLGGGLALFLAQEVTGVWSTLGLPAIHFLYMALIVFALTLCVLGAVSLARPATGEPDGLFRWSDVRPERRARTLIGDYRVQAAALTLLLAISILVWV